MQTLTGRIMWYTLKEFHRLLFCTGENQYLIHVPNKSGTTSIDKGVITPEDFKRTVLGYMKSGEICSFTGTLKGYNMYLTEGGNFNNIIFFESIKKIKVVPYLFHNEKMILRVYANDDELEGVQVLVDNTVVQHIIGCTTELEETSTLVTLPVGNTVTFKKGDSVIFNGEIS